MSNINQFMSGGGYLVGDATYFPDSGTVLNRSDGSVFLRSGTVALTSTYPLTTGVESVMVHGAGIATLPVSFAKITGWATNGSGTIVICYNDTTNVIVSTNNGVSWSSVAHPLFLGGQISAYSVVWNGSRFIVSGGGATSVQCAYSTTGTSFTLGGSVTLAETTSAIARISWDGTTAVIVGGTTSGITKIATTTDGVTLTAQTVPSTAFTYGTVPIVLNVPSLGASRWIICFAGSTVALQSTAANGSAWTSITLPAACVSFSSGLGMFAIASASTIYISTTGTTGSWTTYTPTGIYVVGANNTASFAFYNEWSLHFDGSRFIIGTGSGNGAYQFAYTTDFQKFVTRQIIPNTINSSSSIATACLPVGTGMIFVQNGTGTASNKMIYASNWFSTSEYTGSASPIMQSVTSLGGTPSRPNFGYVRVK